MRNANGLKELPKVGDKVRYVGDFRSYIARGEEYEVYYASEDYFEIVDDVGDELGFDRSDIHRFELAKEPDTAALIANLARRVSELECELDEVKNRDYYDKTVAAYSETEEDAPKAEQIRQACDEVRDLLIRKNHDYGDSFAQQYAKYGLQSALIRMDDKMRRLETLSDGAEAQVAESIEDSLADLAGYALLALVEARAAKK